MRPREVTGLRQVARLRKAKRDVRPRAAPPPAWLIGLLAGTALAVAFVLAVPRPVFASAAGLRVDGGAVQVISVDHLVRHAAGQQSHQSAPRRSVPAPGGADRRVRSIPEPARSPQPRPVPDTAPAPSTVSSPAAPTPPAAPTSSQVSSKGASSPVQVRPRRDVPAHRGCDDLRSLPPVQGERLTPSISPMSPTSPPAAGRCGH